MQSRTADAPFLGVLAGVQSPLVYCNLGAYGSAGPMRDHPGYDPLMQAFSGLMSILGEEGRPPVRVGVAIIDLSTAMWSVIGILAALQRRDRTGQGGRVDTSLYETALACMSVPMAAYACSGAVPQKAGSGAPQIVPYQAFAVADGHLMVSASNDNLFRRLATVIEQPQLGHDSRFRTNADRVGHRMALIEILEAVFITATMQEWVDRLQVAGVRSGPIQTVDQVAAHPQTQTLGMLQTAPGGGLSLMGLPISFDGVRPAFDRLPLSLGEHDRIILPGRAAGAA